MSAPIRFRNLAAGGTALVPLLRGVVATDTLVLGIASGGVPVAAEIARTLRLELDVIFRKALLQGAGEAAGAVNVAGHRILDRITATAPPVSAADHFVVEELEKFDRHVFGCRGERAPARIDSRPVLLVDDGMRTGETMRVCLRAVRMLNPSGVVVAVPVADPAALSTIDSATEVVCVQAAVPFGHVGMFYENFDVPDASRISAIVGAG
ncbi:MAG TPA: phosphoribosyltransferase family protein [Thermoanaerobaculia bacterium]